MVVFPLKTGEPFFPRALLDTTRDTVICNSPYAVVPFVPLHARGYPKRAFLKSDPKGFPRLRKRRFVGAFLQMMVLFCGENL
jgi:hypothetical protein